MGECCSGCRSRRRIRRPSEREESIVSDGQTSEPVVVVSERGAVLEAVINRPAKRNALNQDAAFALGEVHTGDSRRDRGEH